MAARRQISHWLTASRPFISVSKFPFLVSEGVGVPLEKARGEYGDWARYVRARNELLAREIPLAIRCENFVEHARNKRTTNTRSFGPPAWPSRLTLSNLFLHKDLPFSFIFLLNTNRSQKTKLSRFTLNRTSKNKIDSERTVDISRLCDHFSHAVSLGGRLRIS